MNITKLQWWLPKILCLIAACAFWVYVMNEQDPQVETTYTIPVEVRNLDRSLVASNVPDEIHITVRMSRSEMIKTRSDDIKAYVDLSDVTGGDYPNTSIQVTLPSSDESIVSMSPETFDLSVEPYAVKSVPVTVNLFGNSSQGFNPSLDSLTPESVTVAGAQSKVKNVDRAVVSVNIGGKTESFTEFNTVNVLDSNGKTVIGLDIMPVQVKVAVKVLEDKRTATVPLKVVTTGSVASGHIVSKVAVSPSVVTVSAPVSFFRKNQEIKLPAIDINDADSTIEKTIDIPLPEESSATPSSADVTIEVSDSK